ncbi:MAG TPA: DUF6677 family protein [Terriglobia bacterium]|nr:DUF6677 family protein [Terriglobia bacterium]
MDKKTTEAETVAKTSVEADRAGNVLPKTGQLVWLCAAAWLIPGCGHFMLGRKGRALILGIAIIMMFLFGLAMQGEFYVMQSGSILQSLGFLGEMCVGVAMPAAKFFGYSGGDPFFVSADYGTAFLVSAGMLNVLAILDAFDISMGRKS